MARIALVLFLTIMALGRSASAQTESRPQIAGNESTFKAEVTLKGDTTTQRLAIAVVCSEPIQALRIERSDATFFASIPINRFPSGMYFVHVVCESGYIARKFEVRK
jgi:hypothetical protein